MKKIINTILLAGFLVNATAFANAPAGLNVNSAASARINAKANDLVIRQTEPKQILDWKMFDSNNAELIKFHQAGDWSTINRINNIPAQMLGNGQDGSLYLINPNGILFPEGNAVVGCTSGFSVSTSNGLTIGCQGDLSVLGGIVQNNKKISLISTGATNIGEHTSLIAPQVNVQAKSIDEIRLFSDSLPDVPLIRDSDAFKKKVYIDKRINPADQESRLLKDIETLTKGVTVTFGSKIILRDEGENHWEQYPLVAGEIRLTSLSHNIPLTTAGKFEFIKPISIYATVSAVPEPSTYLMILLGLVGVIYLARIGPITQS
ncbi:MAG: PEP-CTERM sorting domain-containing protein [Methylophilaceae bacterium]